MRRPTVAVGLCALRKMMKELGDTGCYTNIVAWAHDVVDFRAKVSRILEKDAWFVVGAEDCQTVDEFDDVPDVLLEQIQTAKSRPDDCIFGTLHYFPSKPC